MFPLLSEALNENVPFKDKIAYLELVNNSHILYLDDEEQQGFLKESITKLMLSSDTRYEGSLYLEALLKNDSKEYYHNWGPVIIASLKCSDRTMSKDLPLRILCDFIQNFAEDPAYSEPLNHFIPEIVEILLKAEQRRPFFTHYCKALAVCMINLPKILANNLIDLEAFIMKNMDCNSLETVQALGECFSALPMCIAYFRKSKQQYAAVWVHTCDRALNTLQVLLNNTLNIPSDVDDYDSVVDVGDSPVFQIPPIPEEATELSKALFYSRMILSLCHCIAALLSGAKKTSVDAPVNDLLQCIVRILNIRDTFELERENFDIHKENKYQYFVLVFPHIQKGILTLLEAIIKSISLHKHSKNFMRLLEMYIELPVIMGYSTGSQCQARTHVFKLITVWLNEYGISGVSAIAKNKKLIEEMLSCVDIIDPHQLTLINGAKVSPLNSTFLKSITTTTCEAMKCLKTLIAYGSSKIDRSLLNEITSKVVGCIQNIQRPIGPLFPFTSDKCRKQLYSLLKSCTVLGDPNQIGKIQLATRLFSVGCRDKSVLVKKVCNNASKLCRLYMEPRKPPPDICYDTLPPHVMLEKKVNVHEASHEISDNWNMKQDVSQQDMHMQNQEEEYLYGADNRMNGGQHHHRSSQSDSDVDSYHDEPSHSTPHGYIPNMDGLNLEEMQPAQMSSQQSSTSSHHQQIVHSLDEEDDEEEDESMDAAEEGDDEEEDEEVEEEEEEEEEEEMQMPHAQLLPPPENGMQRDEAEVYEEDEVYEEVEGHGQENELVTDSRKKNMGFYGLEEMAEDERPVKRQKLVSDEYGQEDDDPRGTMENEDGKVDEEDDKEEEYVEEVEEEEENEEKPEESKTVEKENAALEVEIEPQEIESDNPKIAVPEIPPTNAETDEIPSLAEMKNTFVLDVLES